MKPRAECIRCLITVRLNEIEHSNIDENRKLEVTLELINTLLNMCKSRAELTIIASRTFNFVTSRVPDIVDYYARIKRTTNEKVLRTIHIHRAYSAMLEGFERFKYLVKLSAIGNLIDYGVAGHSAVEPDHVTPRFVQNFEYCVDNTQDFYKNVLRGNKRVAWLFDNSGEAIYDTLLISEIKRLGNTVWGLVKDDPGFQNDITISDALELGLDKILDGLYTYGYQGSTLHLDSIGCEVKRVFEEADLIIAKGMSHYEYLSEVHLDKPIVFILIPKCKPVAMSFSGDTRCLGKIVVTLRSTRVIHH